MGKECSETGNYVDILSQILVLGIKLSLIPGLGSIPLFSRTESDTTGSCISGSSQPMCFRSLFPKRGHDKLSSRSSGFRD